MAEATTITIRTDAGSLRLPAGSTLADALPHLLQAAGHADAPSDAAGASAIATAVNGEFVARTQRAQHVLSDGDTVLCFQAITGG